MKHLLSTALTVSVLVLSFLGCANPSIRTVNEKYFVGKHPKRLVVARFEGKPEFVEESTDYFISELQKETKAEVIRGPLTRPESSDIAGAGNLAPIEGALLATRAKNADLLIVGKVTSHATSGMLNGFSTIRVYDVSSGEEVANFHRPSGKLMAFSEHQCVLAAVKRTARDTVSILKD